MITREEAIKRINNLKGAVFYYLDNDEVIEDPPFPERNPDVIDLEYTDFHDNLVKEIFSPFEEKGTFHIRFGLTKITDKGLKSLSELKLPIISMDLSWTQITDKCVSSLLQLKQLEFIEMEHTSISKASVKILENEGIDIKKNFPPE